MINVQLPRVPSPSSIDGEDTMVDVIFNCLYVSGSIVGYFGFGRSLLQST